MMVIPESCIGVQYMRYLDCYLYCYVDISTGGTCIIDGIILHSGWNELDYRADMYSIQCIVRGLRHRVHSGSNELDYRADMYSIQCIVRGLRQIGVFLHVF
jgi:hypothetical protein